MIDTHQHFWKLDRGDYGWLTPDLEPLYHDFQPEDLAPILKANGIHGTIAVQAADTEAETEYLLALADRHDFILGVIGWVDLEASHAMASIERFAAHPKFVGLRPMIQNIPDDTWMLNDALAPAIDAMVSNNLTFDALVLPRHLGHLDTFLRRYPALSVVINHCAKPKIRNGDFEAWAAKMHKISQLNNVYCKISGLVTEASQDWQEADLKPYIDHILQVFGFDRVMFGSDWPVINLASDYNQWTRIVRSFTSAVSGSDQSYFAKDNALRAYPRLRARS
ncbi:MAG: amidohydrolase family protein [Sulfitobacter sp.]